MFTLKAVETISRDRARAGHEAAFSAFVSHAALALKASADKDAKALRSYMDKHLWDCMYDSGQKSRYLTASLAFVRLVGKKFPEHKRIRAANEAKDAEAFHAEVSGLFTDFGANNVSKALKWSQGDGQAITKAVWAALRGNKPSDTPAPAAPKETVTVEVPASGPPSNPETPPAPPAQKTAKEREADALSEALAAVRKLATPRALAQVMRAVQERQQDIAKARGATTKVVPTEEAPIAKAA